MAIDVEPREKHPIRRVLTIIGCVALACIVALGGYIAYVAANYYRIGDVELEVAGSGEGTVAAGATYSVVTYNIGFGAYQQNYTCVLDHYTYVDPSGNAKEIAGKNLKALSAEDARRNTDGATEVLASLNPDFVFAQEVDTDSDRCYHINQVEATTGALPNYASTYALNFHTPFLAYPLNDMMGSATSGILTLSRFAIAGAARHEFTVDDDFVAKQFDLDRCFSASYANVNNGKQLVLVNVHMSAYDKGGIIRNQQRQELYSFIESEYRSGNYVVVGGDFNHDLVTNNPMYPQYNEETPAFSDLHKGTILKEITRMFDANHDAGLPEGFRVIADDSWGSCRTGAMAWTGETEEMLLYTLDGFIVSPNVTVESVKTIVTTRNGLDGYANSDHEPVFMHFRLQ